VCSDSQGSDDVVAGLTYDINKWDKAEPHIYGFRQSDLHGSSSKSLVYLSLLAKLYSSLADHSVSSDAK
jgi:hypothetical protein